MLRNHKSKFGYYMTQLRESAGLTREGAARLIGVGLNVISDWEEGIVLPSELSAERISKCYHIAINEWLEVLKCEKSKAEQMKRTQ